VLHFPTVLSAVVPVYNLPGNIPSINFTGPVLADIVLGRITKWNDPAIAVHNAAVALPSTDITVVHRADGSGTTFVWADYLSKVSPAFRTTVGVDASLQWPTGIGAKGNEGMAGVIRQIPGAFGYVELVWARQNGLAFGAVQNAAGAFVTASRETISAAAEATLPNMPADFRISMTNGPGQQSYPIASFSWMLLQQHPQDATRGKIMRDFLRWALTDGQRYASDLGYAVLPRPLVQKELEMLAALQ
jgi:phosphate transport system substrate-binding protein